MLLQLIKTRPMITGTHCELVEINSVLGNRHLADVFVLNEHLPLELIYPLSVSWRGICIQGKFCAWQWQNCVVERMVTEYLTSIQRTREEIRIEVCQPTLDLPGYPYVDYHPDDYPVVFGKDIVLLDDLDEDEQPEEPFYIPDYE